MFFSGDLEPISVVNCYLRTVRNRTRGKRGNSEKAYADDIAQFLTFLATREVDLHNVEKTNLIDFAACLLDGISVKTRRTFAASTTARRVRTAISLCQFGVTNGFIQSDNVFGEGSAEEILSIAVAEQSHLDATLKNALIPPTMVGQKIHPIPLRYISRIFDALGPFDWEEPIGRPRRDRLAAEMSLATGMRIDEICSVNVYKILDLQQYVNLNDPWQVFSLELTETKGSIRREVLLPQHLLFRLLHYFDNERRFIVKRAQALGKFKEAGSQPSNLFLNGLESNHRDIGEACRTGTLSRAFSRAVVKVGLTTRLTRFILDDEGHLIKETEGNKWLEESTLIPSFTFHDLRHTYAIENYYIAKKLGESDPVRRIQHLLGHALRHTTESSYLPWVNNREPDYSDQYAELLKSIDGWSRH